jgi:hypothetical protein
LTFTRDDESKVEFANPACVWCGPWSDLVETRALHIATLPHKPEAWWHVIAVVSDLRRQPRVEFPVSFVWNRPTGAFVFVADDRGNGNEASSEQEESGGVIQFDEASCRRGAPVEFSVEGVLDSEFGDDTPIAVRGRFRGTVGAPPR